MVWFFDVVIGNHPYIGIGLLAFIVWGLPPILRWCATKVASK